MATRSNRAKKQRKPIRVEFEEEDGETPEVGGEAGPDVGPPKRGRVKTSGPKVHDPPENWQLMYENIKVMRATMNAPVDTMGCERTSDLNADPKVQRYQTLVSLMLSSQTRDEITYAAMERLKEKGCTPSSIDAMTESDIVNIIKPVGMYNQKAKNIKKTTSILIEQYDSDIPRTAPELLKLPGIGPKMTYLCLKAAWGENVGIGVDTHVHRICRNLGWVKHSKNPEETRIALESWLPREHWQEINVMLVGFGQTICSADPKCGECLNKEICPYGKRKLSKKQK